MANNNGGVYAAHDGAGGTIYLNADGTPFTGANVQQEVPVATFPANTVGGPNAAINAAWRPSQPTIDQLAELYLNPVSGYSPNANYGATLGRWQFSSTGPVPRTAPVGWGRYPGVDGSPGSAPWLAGQTAPPPQWTSLRPNQPPVTVTPPPNTIGQGGWNAASNPLPMTPPNQGPTQAQIDAARLNATTKANGGFGPGVGSGNVPPWYGGNENTLNGTAAGSQWQTFDPTTFKTTTGPVPAQWANYYVPWAWQGKILPVGAFTSLFPNERGNDWSKVKPEGWGESWRPTGPANPSSWG